MSSLAKNRPPRLQRKALKKKVLLVHPGCDQKGFVEQINGDTMVDLTCALNGHEGIRTFYQHKGNFDFIICDLVMPRMDGFTFVASIRPLTSAPILLLADRATLGEESLSYFEKFGVSEFSSGNSADILSQTLASLAGPSSRQIKKGA